MLRGMSALVDLRQFWDDVVAAWVAGERCVPAELSAWHASYSGAGRGQVDLDAFPEPYIGRLDDTPSVVLLGLNPGRPM
jgi:hypothetical protein